MINQTAPFLWRRTNRKIKLDDRIKARSWILMVIRAVEEELARQAPRCANRCCVKVLPKQPSSLGWKKRSIMGEKRWLCETCSSAFDSKQFCEFCSQIYLMSTLEYSGLDGKEWAQCEGPNNCSRWAHVECLSKKYNKTRDEVVAENFKYFCCGCLAMTRGRKRIQPEEHYCKMNDKLNSKKHQRERINNEIA